MPDQNGLIPELDRQLLASLDQQLQVQERGQTDRLYADQESRGFFKSGNTQKRLVGEVLGPGMEARRSAMLGLTKESAIRAQGERQQKEQFGQQKEMAGVNFGYQEQLQKENNLAALDRLNRQAQIQQELLRLEDELSGARNGFWDKLGGSFATSFGSKLGDELGGNVSGGINAAVKGLGG